MLRKLWRKTRKPFVKTVQGLKKVEGGKERRKKLADSLKHARKIDKCIKISRWGRFGESFLERDKKILLSRINNLLNREKQVKVVKILDLGSGSGVYWDKLVQGNPRLKRKLKVVCINPTRTLFRETEVKSLVLGNLLTMNKARFKKFLKEKGKFNLVISSAGSYHYSFEKELFDRRIMDVLIEKKESNFLLLT